MQDPSSFTQAMRFGGRLRFYLNLYRALALVIAGSQLSVNGVVSPLPVGVIFWGVTGYTFFKFLTPASPKRYITGQLLLALDLVFSGFLIWLTGGVSSPFLLYTLSPVLTASLFYSSYLAMTVGVASILDVLLAQLVAPVESASFDATEISYFLIYIAAVSLAASLPYLVNINLQQRLEKEFVTEERQRLSREIHDGTVQTLSAINWQVQIIERELNRRGIEMQEVDKLLRLVEESRIEALESLELLRKYSGAGQMMSHLKNYLHHLKQDAGINYSINLPEAEPSLPPQIELQVLRICQEAMNNIRKHAEAKNIHFEMVRRDEHLRVSIQDDGKGFDSGQYYHGQSRHGHGLNVMKERAISAGGVLKINSVPGKGTILTIDIPLERR
ncbi:Signal transduction histidine kinase [Dehalogenimonas formicexedens]|uniref:Oxygen sensor histidine kinase NreB n=1 Tax=Dehalogenimonas formicexedens TaxID=1839801 RepID=A0A1P8F793_9CHLR|nr:sensor histidine kinase [Dehalogenimonas formicexedens]APV44351.1 Signal transduction histidine kinase [Dehalogenimonas formicexedens]